MDDGITKSPWWYRTLYVGVFVVILMWQLVPLQTVPRAWAYPDLMLAMTFCWVLRRPDYCPVFLIALVFLFQDFMLQRPPGIWTACVIVGAEFLRSRMLINRDLPFAFEWLLVTAVLIVMAVVSRVVLSVFLVPPAPVALDASLIGFTIVVYPLIVVISQYGLGVWRRQPGTLDSMGHGA